MNDESFEQEIAKLDAEVGQLTVKHDKLRRKYEAEQVQMARYSRLVDRKERLEREIAAMEGRRNEDGGDEDCPDPPDA
ncbi:MAG: hypothetical protein JWR26_2031 [Pedosphaera sp.]|nr:hypothetical protein [Pedosphaera sp.]